MDFQSAVSVRVIETQGTGDDQAEPTKNGRARVGLKRKRPEVADNPDQHCCEASGSADADEATIEKKKKIVSKRAKASNQLPRPTHQLIRNIFIPRSDPNNPISSFNMNLKKNDGQTVLSTNYSHPHLAQKLGLQLGSLKKNDVVVSVNGKVVFDVKAEKVLIPFLGVIDLMKKTPAGRSMKINILRKTNKKISTSPLSSAYVCSQCNRPFTCQKGLDYHVEKNVCRNGTIRKISTSTSSSSYTCQHCNKSFKTERGLDYHVKQDVCQNGTVRHTKNVRVPLDVKRLAGTAPYSKLHEGEKFVTQFGIVEVVADDRIPDDYGKTKIGGYDASKVKDGVNNDKLIALSRSVARYKRRKFKMEEKARTQWGKMVRANIRKRRRLGRRYAKEAGINQEESCSKSDPVGGHNYRAEEPQSTQLVVWRESVKNPILTPDAIFRHGATYSIPRDYCVAGIAFEGKGGIKVEKDTADVVSNPMPQDPLVPSNSYPDRIVTCRLITDERKRIYDYNDPDTALKKTRTSVSSSSMESDLDIVRKAQEEVKREKEKKAEDKHKGDSGKGRKQKKSEKSSEDAVEFKDNEAPAQTEKDQAVEEEQQQQQQQQKPIISKLCLRRCMLTDLYNCTDLVFICRYCAKTFSSRVGLKDHVFSRVCLPPESGSEDDEERIEEEEVIGPKTPSLLEGSGNKLRVESSSKEKPKKKRRLSLASAASAKRYRMSAFKNFDPDDDSSVEVAPSTRSRHTPVKDRYGLDPNRRLSRKEWRLLKRPGWMVFKSEASCWYPEIMMTLGIKRGSNNMNWKRLETNKRRFEPVRNPRSERRAKKKLGNGPIYLDVIAKLNLWEGVANKGMYTNIFEDLGFKKAHFNQRIRCYRRRCNFPALDICGDEDGNYGRIDSNHKRQARKRTADPACAVPGCPKLSQGRSNNHMCRTHFVQSGGAKGHPEKSSGDTDGKKRASANSRGPERSSASSSDKRKKHPALDLMPNNMIEPQSQLRSERPTNSRRHTVGDTDGVAACLQKYPVGTVLSKEFDGVVYRGRVISYDPMPKHYKLRYDQDGYQEEMEEKEVERHLGVLV